MTAALVTSIADVSTSCSTSGSPPSHDNVGGSETTKQQASRTRSQAENLETDLNHTIEFPRHEQEGHSGAHALVMGHASHVTPTASEASSFSSVETLGDHESSATASISTVCAHNQDCEFSPRRVDMKSQPQTPTGPIAARPVVSSIAARHAGGNARTCYPRASKSAASTKVSTALASTIKSSTVNGSSAPLGVAPAKRKIDAGETFDRMASIFCSCDMVF